MSAVDRVVVTSGPRAPRNKAILETPAGKKDVQVYVMGWARQAAVRTVRTYLQCLVGFLPAVPVANAVADAVDAGFRLPMGDFLDAFLIAASLSVGPAVVAFLHNAIEILSKLDNPETRA